MVLQRPLTMGEGRGAGATSTAVEGKTWRRLGSKLYSWSGLNEDPWEVLVAWRRLLPADAVFAGETAAWMAGLDFSPTDPVEIVVPSNSGLRSRPGLRVRRCRILPGEVVTFQKPRATSLPRTFHHLSLRLPAVEILVAIVATLRTQPAPAKALQN